MHSSSLSSYLAGQKRIGHCSFNKRHFHGVIGADQDRSTVSGSDGRERNNGRIEFGCSSDKISRFFYSATMKTLAVVSAIVTGFSPPGRHRTRALTFCAFAW